MDFSALAKNLLSIADTVVPLVGGPAGAAAIALAHKVIDTIDSVKSDLKETDQVVLQKKRDELEAVVMAHADRTIDSLD